MHLDHVREFLTDCTRPGGTTRSSVLYDTYCKYESGYRGRAPISSTEFYYALRDLGYPARKSNGVMVRDLAIVVQHDDAAEASVVGAQTYLDGQPVATVAFDDAGAKLDAIVACYSKHGKNMTMRETADHFGISEDEVRATLKAANVRKSDPPFDPARVEAEDVDDLVDEGLAIKRERYKVEAARRERADLERRALEAESMVRDHELKRQHIMNGIRVALRDVEPIEFGEPAYHDDGWAAHAPVADPHVGLQVYGKESWTSENYHTDLAAERIVDAAARAAGWIDSMRGMLGAPRVIHYSIVGDLFHALHYATVSGRPMQVDGRSRRVFEKVVNAVATACTTLVQVAPVECRITDGNHDGDLAFYVATTLAAFFNNTPLVRVESSYNHQCAFVEGETTHILDHGRSWTSLDAKKVGAEAANIRAEMAEMYGMTKRAKIWVADKHSPAGAWHGRHVEVIRVPALASLDDYAQGLNYSHDFDAYVYALTERGGIAHQGRLYE
jgi:hypothetical protein